MKPSVILSILILSVACGTKVNQEGNVNADSTYVAVAPDTAVADTTRSGYDNGEKPASADNNAILELNDSELLIAGMDGVSVKEAPDENSNFIDNATYGEGTLLILVDELNDWYKVKTISGETGYESMTGFVRKTDVVTIEQIPFEDELSELREEPSQVMDESTNVEIKLVTKGEFYEKQKKSVEFLTYSKSIVKGNATTKLPTKSGYKEYRDDLSDTYNTYYDYYGQFDVLNLYIVLVTCQECEEYSWLLIDKDTGEDKGELGGPPKLSYDKRIFAAVENLYGEATEFSFYSYTGKVEVLSYHEFSRWVPSEEIDGFWSNDGWFYMAVLPIANNWRPIEVKNQEKKLKLRYIKIRPAKNKD